jgi:cell wall-associated NlpC family hydrolase
VSSQQQRSARFRALPGALVALVALLASLFAAAAAAADPTPTSPPAVHVDPAKVDPTLHRHIADVTTQLAHLARENDRLDEQFNHAVIAVADRQNAARQAQVVAGQAADAYRAAHARFLQELTSQYEGGSAASVGVLLGNNDPQGYLDGLNLAEYLSNQLASVVGAEHAARANAITTARTASHDLTAALAEQAALTAKRTALQKQQQKFTDLLHSLSAQQRREVAHARALAETRARAALVANAAVGAPPVAGPMSAQVSRVVAYAEAQVGKPYIFGAAGPGAYDCSGLTMQAWAQAGVALPHSAADQYTYGRHVSYDQLQPGDLIFLYSPIDHVELYVGNDLAVSAADPALGIIYVHPSTDLADYAGATRLAG